MRFVMHIPTEQIQELVGKALSAKGGAGTRREVERKAQHAAALLTAQICRRLLDAAITENRMLMRLAKLSGSALPPLYKTRVIYRHEPRPNNLENVLTVYRRGWGDCKHLVCIRVAEQLELGKEAHPLVYWRYDENGDPYIYHAELRHGPRNGRGPREDPSRFLGM